MASGQNSGTGIPGKAGSKSCPAAKSSSETTGSDTNDHNRAVRQQDSSKIRGQPGNKSGPAVKAAVSPQRTRDANYLAPPRSGRIEARIGLR